MAGFFLGGICCFIFLLLDSHEYCGIQQPWDPLLQLGMVKIRTHKVGIIQKEGLETNDLRKARAGTGQQTLRGHTQGQQMLRKMTK